jgi:hypothetical protein
VRQRSSPSSKSDEGPLSFYGNKLQMHLQTDKTSSTTWVRGEGGRAARQGCQNQVQLLTKRRGLLQGRYLQHSQTGAQGRPDPRPQTQNRHVLYLRPVHPSVEARGARLFVVPFLGQAN